HHREVCFGIRAKDFWVMFGVAHGSVGGDKYPAHGWSVHHGSECSELLVLRIRIPHCFNRIEPVGYWNIQAGDCGAHELIPLLALCQTPTECDMGHFE